MLKRFLQFAAIVIVLGFGVKAVSYYSSLGEPITQNHVPIAQEKYTHSIVFRDGAEAGLCTATAIGPHALLTAEHCNDGLVPIKIVFLDASTHAYHLLARYLDDRDHVIYILDGPPFATISPYFTRKPKLGEKVVLVGCGKNDYPCVIKRGKVIDEYDPSDIDQESGIFYFGVPVEHGDSGAVIYGEDGAILGIVTYLIVDGEGSGFELKFSESEIEGAQKYLGDSDVNTTNSSPAAPTGLAGESH